MVSSGRRRASETPIPCPRNVSSQASFPAHWSRVGRNLSNEVRPGSAVATAWSSLDRDASESGLDIVHAREVQSCFRGPDPMPSSNWRVKPGSGLASLPGRSRPRRLHGTDRARRAWHLVRISSGNFLARREPKRRCGRVVEGATVRNSAPWSRCSASAAWQVFRCRVPRTLLRNLRTR